MKFDPVSFCLFKLSVNELKQILHFWKAGEKWRKGLFKNKKGFKVKMQNIMVRSLHK
jgi:hypothetical protein